MPKSRIQNIITDILSTVGFSNPEISFDEVDGTMIFVSLKVDSPNTLIGQNGETLNAINYLVSKILEKEFTGQEIPHFIVDVNNFRRKKIENIRTNAHMLAERVKYFKSEIEAEPMSAYDRKIMHSYLQNIKNIKTESVGFGRDRHIVIKFIEE
jgi:spoIIIJ-associated protein